ncbi:hypothetical protein SY85_12545 [Flavisolibacter tropicus]|uniref:Uncharacterized protein n=1 Tax=Flavisolibacter tropicus TaxID=1492898 RepID=A0A172TVR5_9BACT|nr:hypothetical protein SY85_12545 [Flavisolibacter tropicus]
MPEVAGRKLFLLGSTPDAQAKMGVPFPISLPDASYRLNVPHKAKEVLNDPVLLFIPNISCLVPLHVQGSKPGGTGSVALINSKSLDVQDEAGGNV